MVCLSVFPGETKLASCRGETGAKFLASLPDMKHVNHNTSTHNQTNTSQLSQKRHKFIMMQICWQH